MSWYPHCVPDHSLDMARQAIPFTRERDHGVRRLSERPVPRQRLGSPSASRCRQTRPRREARIPPTRCTRSQV